jgi:Tfp pilus assembly protein PilO
LSSVSKINSYGFSLTASGKYSSLNSFIDHLLNWKRLVTINNLDFSKEISTPGANIRLSLKGTTYYEP